MNSSKLALKHARINSGLEKLRAPLSVTVALLSTTALFGYVADVPQLYRPIATAGATHPFTALALLLIALAILWRGPSKIERLVHFYAALLVLSIASVRLADGLFGTAVLDSTAPFLARLHANLDVINRVEMGLNTSVMLLLLSIALILESRGLGTFSQATSFVGLLFPSIALTGYAYGLTGFFGSMSILTASCGLILGLVILSLKKEQGPVRAMLSPHLGGKLARLHLAAGYLIPLIAGYFAVNMLFTQQATLFGALVILTTWLVLILASVTAVIVENAEAKRRVENAELERQAQLDTLTELSNRRHLEQISQHEIARAQRSGRDLWVLMIDLDHFKLINDTAGHAMGDKVLKAIALTLRSNVRRTDLVARTGGEEFSVLMPETNIHGAKQVAEKLRRAILGTVVTGWTDRHSQVSASIGCARWLQEETIEPSLARADIALYNSKSSGRNRISVDPASRPDAGLARATF